MNAEVREAAERLRRVGNEPLLDIYPKAKEKPRMMQGEWSTWHAEDMARSWVGDDQETLADAYLAEHDPTQIDEEWLISVGFKKWDLEEDRDSYELFILMRDEIGWECRLAYQSNGFYAVRICEEQEFGVAESVELLGTRNKVPAVTRGAVRRLCTALNIPLKANP